MLEQIREKAPRWLVSLILLLLVIPFALWGINSYVQPHGGADAARSAREVVAFAGPDRTEPAT